MAFRSLNSSAKFGIGGDMIKTQIVPALLMTFWLLVSTCIVFPLAVWGVSSLIFPFQAGGSFVKLKDNKMASKLIGQKFTSEIYFHSRPSAAGAGYDPLSSGGTNLGPTSKKLIEGIVDDPATSDVDESYVGMSTLAKIYREVNDVLVSELIPPDAVTRSASGLDPHISPRNAMLQAKRVAQVRGLELNRVQQLIDVYTEERFLGIFGEPRVNVLVLNLALDQL